MEKKEIAIKLKIYEAHVEYARFCSEVAKKAEKESRANLTSSQKSKHIKLKKMYSERAFKNVEEAVKYLSKAESEYTEALIVASKYSLAISTEYISNELKLIKQEAKRLSNKKNSLSLDRILP